MIKPSAASPALLKHSGRALVFEDHAELSARIDDPDLDVDANSVLVMRNAGPVGAPGMPEWGNLPIPKKLMAQGVRDMVLISDGRMSGTHYGTGILHVAPESAAGGTLALIKTGDIVDIDVPAKSLNLRVIDAELGLPPRRLESAAATLRAQLCASVSAACFASHPRLRLRFSRRSRRPRTAYLLETFVKLPFMPSKRGTRLVVGSAMRTTGARAERCNARPMAAWKA